MDIETIRRAVTKNRGGLNDATDAQIMIIWDSLDEQTRQEYLQKISKERKGKNADSTGT